MAQFGDRPFDVWIPVGGHNYIRHTALSCNTSLVRINENNNANSLRMCGASVVGRGRDPYQNVTPLNRPR